MWNHESREYGLDFRYTGPSSHIHGFANHNRLVPIHWLLIMLVTMSWRRSRQGGLSPHSERRANYPIQQGEANKSSKCSRPIVRPHMPFSTTLSQVHSGGSQWVTTRAAYFSVPEGVRFAVSQLPIAHCCLSDVNKEGYTSCKDADQGGGDPA